MQIPVWVCTVTFYVLGFTLLGFMYYWFVPEPSCELNNFFITFSLFLSVCRTRATAGSRRCMMLESFY